MRKLSTRAGALAALALMAAFAVTALAACGEDEGSGGGGKQVKVLAFNAPSLGAFVPAVIDAKGLDSKHGLDMKFTYTTPDNYNAEFAAGNTDVGGSAALLSEALRSEKGAKSTYLFNVFDYFGAVVTDKDDVKSLPDLDGKSLAAATGTTNYAMFEWFAKEQGLDAEKTKRLNQTTPGLSTMALSGRADATQLWEPAYSGLIAQDDDIRTLDMGIPKWKQRFGTERIPYLGVASTPEWVKKNPKLVKPLYDTYKEAADYIAKNPDDAAKIIAAKIPNGKPETIKELIENNDRLGLRVTPASELRKPIEAVFEAGQETGYLKKDPPSSIVGDAGS